MAVGDPAREMIRAAKSGSVARIRELLEQDPALLNARDADGSTPLHCAAWKGHVPAVELLLDSGADVNAQSQNGHYGGTPLHAAAHGNSRAVAELLVNRGADVQATSCNGRTPLEETALHNATTVANFLRRRAEG
jgi:ankyrin repeat protein